jgi:hypothetical protein
MEVIFVPVAVVFLGVLLMIAMHSVIAWLLIGKNRDPTSLLIALGLVLGGILLIGRSLVGMLVPRVADTEVPGVTAIALALGPALVAYGAWIAGSVASRHGSSARAYGPQEVSRFATWYGGDRAARLRRGALVCVVGLVIAGMFWAAHQFAWAYGAGLAYEDARHMSERPELILETKDRLADLSPGIVETIRTPGRAAKDGTSFRYRYRGLRLLLAAGGRLFLVPEHWTAESRTLIIPYDANIRIQLNSAE